MHSYKDYTIINYDKLTYAGNIEYIKDLDGDSRYCFIKGDICDSKQVNAIIREYKPHYVINFAAESHVDRSIDDPLIFGHSNVIGTMNLLDCFNNYWKKNDYADKRFLQVSTDEVYGSLDNTDNRFTEDSAIMPNSPYSASKAGADLITRAYAKTYHFPVIVTRCCNNYGPNQNQEKFIPTCITKALKDEPIPIYGDGTNRREWIHVLDHSVALAKTLFQGNPGEVYNIGSGEEVSNIEMATMILQIMGKKTGALIKAADRPGHDWRYALDSSKIKTHLNWNCRYKLSEGLADTVKWYQDSYKHMNIKK